MLQFKNENTMEKSYNLDLKTVGDLTPLIIEAVIMEDEPRYDLLAVLREVDGETNGFFATTLCYDMDMFDDFERNTEPSDLANKIFFGNFNPNHAYFRYDSYGNLESVINYEAYYRDCLECRDDLSNNIYEFHDGDLYNNLEDDTLTDLMDFIEENEDESISSCEAELQELINSANL